MEGIIILEKVKSFLVILLQYPPIQTIIAAIVIWKLIKKRIIIFSLLHKERASVIIEWYRQLNNLETLFNSFNGLQLGIELSEMNYKEINEKIDTGLYKFLDYYSENKLYFSEDICKQMEEINKQFNFVTKECKTYLKYIKENNLPKHINPYDHIKTVKSSMSEIAKSKKIIENEFRDILGVK